MTGLLGGNGAGKTTTIAMMHRAGAADAREASGYWASNARASAAVLGRMNFESPYVDMPMRLTVGRTCTIFGRLYARAAPRASASRNWRADLDLGEFLDRANGQLSAGQKTRVALAKALINRPELLLLDEPTPRSIPIPPTGCGSYLEPYRKTRGATILLASHNMAEVERLCDRVIMMKRGPHRRRRQPERASSPATAAHAGGGLPRRRRAAGAQDDRAVRQARRRTWTIAPHRRAMMLRYCTCCARPGRVFSSCSTGRRCRWSPGAFCRPIIAQNAGSSARAGGALIGAVLLWDILFRGQLGFSISFLEEMWARNLGNLFVSPLRPLEFV